MKRSWLESPGEMVIYFVNACNHHLGIVHDIPRQGSPGGGFLIKWVDSMRISIFKMTSQDWDFGTTNLRSRRSFSGAPNTPRTPGDDDDEAADAPDLSRRAVAIWTRCFLQRPLTVNWSRWSNITTSSFQTLGILIFLKVRDTLKPSHKWVLQKTRGWLIHLYTYNMITYIYTYIHSCHLYWDYDRL